MDKYKLGVLGVVVSLILVIVLVVACAPTVIDQENCLSNTCKGYEITEIANNGAVAVYLMVDKQNHNVCYISNLRSISCVPEH